MKIRELCLFTKNLELEKAFYTKTLGFKLIEETQDSFTLKIGWSKLIFRRTERLYKYHYCFLIPSNKHEEAMQWMEKRTTVLDIENGRKTQRFESWNADSFYFYDASGNVAEFIVRYDLKNNSDKAFCIDDVICVNEIGLPTISIQETNSFLEKELNSAFWKGNKTYFGTNGTQEGLLLLPNYEVRKKWFPTDLDVEPSPFSAVLETDKDLFEFNFLNDTINVKKR